mgnify:FL=1
MVIQNGLLVKYGKETWKSPLWLWHPDETVVK